MRVTGAWSESAAAAFLEEVRIPIRLACHTPQGRLWMLSLWYAWVDDAEGGDGAAATDPDATPELRCATAAGADVVAYLRQDPAVAFEVSTNHPPYRGVRGYGTVRIEPDTDKALLRSLFDRYLGGTDNRLGDRLLDPEREEVRLRIDPERLHSWDFSGRMGDVDAGRDGVE